MLDLNYVRENLEKVRAALQTRGLAPEVLDSFAAADADRRLDRRGESIHPASSRGVLAQS